MKAVTTGGRTDRQTDRRTDTTKSFISLILQSYAVDKHTVCPTLEITTPHSTVQYLIFDLWTHCHFVELNALKHAALIYSGLQIASSREHI